MLKPAVDDLLYTACVRHLCGICIKSDHISTSMYHTGCSGWNCDNMHFIYAVNKVIRHSRGYLWSSFWHSFKTNMKQGAFVTLVVAAAVVLVGLDGYIMYQFAKVG